MVTRNKSEFELKVDHLHDMVDDLSDQPWLRTEEEVVRIFFEVLATAKSLQDFLLLTDSAATLGKLSEVQDAAHAAGFTDDYDAIEYSELSEFDVMLEEAERTNDWSWFDR